MRIAMLTDGIPPFVVGGMQKHSLLVTEYLARAGVEILLYHYVEGDSPPTVDEVLSEFSEEVRTKIKVKSFSYKDDGKLPGHYLKAQSSISKAYFNSLLEEDGSFDFIYTKGFVGEELIKRRGELSKPTPIGVKFHGMNMFQKQPDFKGEITKYLFRGKVRWIMKNADVVFSYGGKITDIIESTGVARETIAEVPSGIEEDWLRSEITPTGNRLKFLFVGRYDRLKGLPELYRALSKLNTDFSLDFIGPIPKDRQVDDARVTYAGLVKDKVALLKKYDEADVLLCPSISEGMPNVIIEAMARGLAVIASDVGAISMLVSRANGWLIESAAPLNIQNAMSECLEKSPTDIDKLKRLSLRTIQENFVWGSISKQLIQKIENEIEVFKGQSV